MESGQADLETAVRRFLAEALRVPFEQVAGNLGYGELPQWDSVGHMDMVLELEQRFAVRVETHQIPQLVSVSSIAAFLRDSGRM